MRVRDFSAEVMIKNPAHMPMVDSHFYLWLFAQDKPSSREIKAIHAYLETLQFEKGRDVINSSAFRTLATIHMHYFMVRNQARPVSQRIGYHTIH
jgi:hypothetical protein